MGRMCKGDADSAFEKVRTKLDTACVGCVRLLESLCCLDLNRFAKPEKPLTGSLPILFVLMLIVMLYNAFVFGYMPAAGIAVNSSTSLLFHAWIFMTLASFFQAVRTDPGSTPTTPGWCDKEHPPAEARERKRCAEEARWCRKSGAYKPDRAHYCRVLKKGVLRMDHYCPWLGNTVGFHNQKFFFLFLFYTNAACAQLGISFIQLLVQYTLPALTTFCLIGAEGLTVLITSLLVPFFSFHFYLIARNTTTIEFCERMRSNAEDAEVDPMLPSRYDLGIFGNFSAVLGSNPLLWLLPVGGPAGDGITFPINPEYLKAVAATKATADVEQAESCCAANDDPEASHPAASSEAAQDMDKDSDLEQGSGDGKLGENESEQEAASGQCEQEASEEEGSEAAASASTPSEIGAEGFLVWRDSAEFVEDLTIGCQFIGEKVEDCSRSSFLCLMASCMPGALGRKAARGLAGSRRQLAPWKRGNAPDSERRFLEGSRLPLRSSSPAVKIVSVRGAGALGSSEEEGECDSCSNASGFLLSD